MTQLTRNFSLHELTKSETALRHDMENEPGSIEIANLVELAAKVLQPIRDHYAKGVKVNSGFRHPDVNAKVGGSRTSDHCKGMAADIEIPGVPTQSWLSGSRLIWNSPSSSLSFTPPAFLTLDGSMCRMTPRTSKNR